MRKLLLTIILPTFFLFPSRVYAAAFTWNGATSDWNTPSNWLEGGMTAMSVPGPVDDVIIDGTSGVTPTLPSSLTIINSIDIINASLFMDGKTLQLLGSGGTIGIFFDGATITGNGGFICFVMEELTGTTFEGNMAIQKFGGALSASDVLSGGNTFEGTFTFTQESGASGTVFANSSPDIFMKPVALNNKSDDPIDMAFGSAAPTQFQDDVIMDSDALGGIAFGNGGGTSTLSGTLTAGTEFSLGDLIIKNLTQTGNDANGIFVTINFEVENSTLQGGISVLAISGMRLVNSSFASKGASNILNSTNIEEVSGCDFSLSTGMTTLEQIIAASDNTWSGGNNFGHVEILNSSAGDLQLATISPNNYDGNVLFSRSGTGVLEPAFAANSTFAGDITTSGVIDFGVGGGAVVIDGETDQELTRLSGTITIDKLTIDQLTPNTFTPNVPITINTNLTLTNGILVSSSAAANIILPDGATVSGGNDQSYVAGKLKKIGNDAFTFPVGNGGFIAPLGISAPNNINAEFTAEYFHQTPPNSMSISGGNLDHVSSVEYWELSGTSNVKVTLTWAGRSGGIDITSELRVTQLEGGSWKSLPSSSSGTTAMGSVTTQNNLNSYGNFTLGSATVNNPLPVELLYFTAVAEGVRVRLDWATASEQNHAAFHVERSADGEIFEAIFQEAGDGRDRYLTKTYQWYDENPLPGISYYRLRQIDVDGAVDFSDIRSVIMVANDDLHLEVYPNPAAEVLRLRSETDLSGSAIRLFNAAGQVVPSQPEIGERGAAIPVAHLSAGVYVLQIIREGHTTIGRVVISR